jgi:hypothetical protein
MIDAALAHGPRHAAATPPLTFTKAFQPYASTDRVAEPGRAVCRSASGRHAPRHGGAVWAAGTVHMARMGAG